MQAGILGYAFPAGGRPRRVIRCRWSSLVSKRVVVTGHGLRDATRPRPAIDLAGDAEAGKSGVAPIQGFDTTDHEVKIAGEIPTFDPTKIMNAKEARRIDRFIQLGMYAAARGVPARRAGGHAGERRADRRDRRLGHRRHRDAWATASRRCTTRARIGSRRSWSSRC